MSEQVEKTDYDILKNKARTLGGIDLRLSPENLKAAIDTKESEDAVVGPTGITIKDARDIKARLKYEEETREEFSKQRALLNERARIIAESESLSIPIELTETPNELDLARARKTLGLKKIEVKPSPETVAIEASKRGYYQFTNREQSNASHSPNLGGRYPIQLIPDQIHVLSEYHVKKWKQIATVPVYERVETGVSPGPDTVGRVAEQSILVSHKPRFVFEYLHLRRLFYL